jgi:hypothetical protein
MTLVKLSLLVLKIIWKDIEVATYKFESQSYQGCRKSCWEILGCDNKYLIIFHFKSIIFVC